MYHCPLHEVEFLHPTDLYHVSNEVWDRPKDLEINKGNQFTTTHHNSPIGLWASTKPSSCKGFGQYLYKLTMDPNAKNLGITYEDWKELGTEHVMTGEGFIALRKHIRSERVCDVLYIIDASHGINEVIIINYDVILKSERIEWIQDFHVPMRHSAKSKYHLTWKYGEWSNERHY